jgi:hypothetical protein
MSCVSEFQSLKSGDQISAKIDTAFEKCSDCGADGLVNQKKGPQNSGPLFRNAYEQSDSYAATGSSSNSARDRSS